MVRFYPQVQTGRKGDIIKVPCPDGREYVEYEVSAQEVMNICAMPDPEPDTYDSDPLKYASTAPDWVKAWEGPFYCVVLEE